MRKIYLLFILFSSVSLFSQQLQEISISQKSQKEIISLTIGNAAISIDTNGNLSNAMIESKSKVRLNNQTGTTFQGDADIDYDDPKSFSKKDDIFDYYDNFSDYNSGKIESINGIKFEYYDGFNAYQKGKISSIGDLKITYHDGFYAYQKGKLASVGTITFSYFDSFYKFKSGKLESVKGNKNRVKITVTND